jgi:hypothetical protein
MTLTYRAISSFAAIALLAYSVRAQTDEPLRWSDHTCTLRVNPALPPYSFRFIINEDTSEVGAVQSVSSIQIRLNNKPQVLQVLRGFKTYHPFSVGDFEAKDVNFDGYLDILLMYDRGAASTDSHVWLFDPSTGKFRYDKQLSEISNLEPDPLTKTIESNVGFSAGEGDVELYRFEEGKIARISRIETRFNEAIQRSIRITKLFRHNKVISTKVDTLSR